MLVSGLEVVAIAISTHSPGKDSRFLPPERPKVTLLPDIFLGASQHKIYQSLLDLFPRQLGSSGTDAEVADALADALKQSRDQVLANETALFPF